MRQCLFFWNLGSDTLKAVENDCVQIKRIRAVPVTHYECKRYFRTQNVNKFNSDRVVILVNYFNSNLIFFYFPELGNIRKIRIEDWGTFTKSKLSEE